MVRNAAFATTFEARWATLPLVARSAQAGMTLRNTPSGTVPLAARESSGAPPKPAGAAQQMGICACPLGLIANVAFKGDGRSR